MWGGISNKQNKQITFWVVSVAQRSVTEKGDKEWACTTIVYVMLMADSTGKLHCYKC